MKIRRGWTRQIAATALLVAACGMIGTLVARGDSSGPAAKQATIGSGSATQTAAR